MGCTAHRSHSSSAVERDAGRPLIGSTSTCADISDLVPSLAAVAVMASSPTRIRGVGFVRAKESDRLGDLAGELAKLGADVAVEPRRAADRARGTAARRRAWRPITTTAWRWRSPCSAP